MLTQVYESIMGLVLPELCPRCENPTVAGFCQLCRDDFPVNPDPCPLCAEPMRGNGCLHDPRTWKIDATLAPFLYARPVDLYIHALKFSGRRMLGRSFGQLLAEHAIARRSRVDALVSVPLHAGRLRERGYNQAFEIARSLSAGLHLPVLLARIARRRPTAPQSQLPAAQRRRNLRGAFAVDRDLGDLRLAIVDDVITTGATVNALAASLRAAGAAHIEAWAVARTPPETSSAAGQPLAKT